MVGIARKALWIKWRRFQRFANGFNVTGVAQQCRRCAVRVEKGGVGCGEFVLSARGHRISLILS
jgi:hypothetical protein